MLQVYKESSVSPVMGFSPMLTDVDVSGDLVTISMIHRP